MNIAEFERGLGSKSIGLAISGRSPESTPTASSSPLKVSFNESRASFSQEKRGERDSSTFLRHSLACPPPRKNPILDVPQLPNGPARVSYENSGLSRKATIKRLKSTALDERPIEKPWLQKKDIRARLSYCLTVICMFLGAAAAAVVCYMGAKGVRMVGNVCLVLDEDFNNGIDSNIWFHEVSMSGFG